MYLLVALIVSITFFFLLDLGLTAKLAGLGFCIFAWASNRIGILNVEGAAKNPLVMQFMLIGSIGTILGIISIFLDLIG
jgi:hypothetical protein